MNIVYFATAKKTKPKTSTARVVICSARSLEQSLLDLSAGAGKLMVVMQLLPAAEPVVCTGLQTIFSADNLDKHGGPAGNWFLMAPQMIKLIKYAWDLCAIYGAGASRVDLIQAFFCICAMLRDNVVGNRSQIKLAAERLFAAAYLPPSVQSGAASAGYKPHQNAAAAQETRKILRDSVIWEFVVERESRCFEPSSPSASMADWSLITQDKISTVYSKLRYMLADCRLHAAILDDKLDSMSIEERLDQFSPENLCSMLAVYVAYPEWFALPTPDSDSAKIIQDNISLLVHRRDNFIGREFITVHKIANDDNETKEKFYHLVVDYRDKYWEKIFGAPRLPVQPVDIAASGLIDKAVGV